jgi:hypothetical protein
VVEGARTPKHVGRAAVRAVATFLIGLLAGAMAEEYLLLRYVLEGLPGETWVALHARFADVHPYTVIPTAVLGMTALLATFFVESDTRSPRAIATWVAVGVAVGVGLLTSLVMMPLNDVIQQWAVSGVPDTWMETREQWIELQGVRALLSVVGFAALVVAGRLSATKS